jgi:hypothetical protein
MRFGRTVFAVQEIASSQAGRSVFFSKAKIGEKKFLHWSKDYRPLFGLVLPTISDCITP